MSIKNDCSKCLEERNLEFPAEGLTENYCWTTNCPYGNAMGREILSGEDMGRKLYLFNVTIFTGGEGTYLVKKHTKEEARLIWKNYRGAKVSAVGHEATAKVLSTIMDEEIPVNRIAAVQEPGDLALCMKMIGRIPEGTVLTDMAELEKIGYEFYSIRFER